METKWGPLTLQSVYAAVLLCERIQVTPRGIRNARLTIDGAAIFED